jgi:hypothetical protein
LLLLILWQGCDASEFLKNIKVRKFDIPLILKKLIFGLYVVKGRGEYDLKELISLRLSQEHLLSSFERNEFVLDPVGSLIRFR